jgi:hypothetical protein
MPKDTKGILIETDTATKIYLTTLKENFIIETFESDDSCIFIDESQLDYVWEKVRYFKNNISKEVQVMLQQGGK